MYRGYYGLGVTAGMIGTPASQTQWRVINRTAAAVLLAAALLPVAALPLWRRARPRQVLLALCWALAVGCLMLG
jgi:heme A synthase